ncbi:hypothetical protein [Evansella tamaricis]|uniref:Uncharacterized protein n=1 Tax=Evansella tamaricis TaxID=2069301 RepID=A0ABS6JHS0_9BACI|nr:hypothetical protein [Evansella tamaricis]MBU9713187.1 hypothetical protein [Evansella tamaricis]
MKVDEDLLSVEEGGLYGAINGLRGKQKSVLFDMIRDSNSDHTVVCSDISDEIRRLEAKGFIRVVPNYSGEGYCFYVLPDASILLAMLRKQARRQLVGTGWKRKVQRLFRQ